jgi:hypothetical protein
VERAADYGIPASDVVVDPLVMPSVRSTGPASQVMRLVRRLREELKVNTTCGASNVSFGLPNREGINAAFLTMAIASGLTSAITNPLHVETVRACMGADVMMGHDPDCARWIRRFREGATARNRRSGGPWTPARVVTAAAPREAIHDRKRRALVVFTPSGKRGRLSGGHAALLQAARVRSASTSIRYAADAASVDAARF